MESNGGIAEVNNADQIGQLSALRFKMKSGNYNLPSSKSAEISETKRRECGRKFQTKKLKINMETRPGKLKAGRLENTGILNGFISRKFRMVR